MQKAILENSIFTIKRIADDLADTLPLKNIKKYLKNLGSPHIDWPVLKIGDLAVKTPIVQGGMGVGLSLSGLASAVADTGGIGVIAANAIGMLEKDYFHDGRKANLRVFRREIRTARRKSNGIIGVNIMVAVNDFHELLNVAIEERADLVFMGAGLPIKNIPVKRMRDAGVKAVPIISSVRAAEMIFKMWKKIYNDIPDAVVFEGPLAGGHLGFSEEQIDKPEFQLEYQVPLIVEALKPFETEFSRKIPVIAGGGIFTGEDIQMAMQKGAAAVQLGTRFIATDECDADIAFKQAYLECVKKDIGLIISPVGMPGRAIRNNFIKDSEKGISSSFKCAWQCLASCKAEKANYCISIALNNARKGRLNQGFVFAGANAWRIDKIIPVSELIVELSEGYRTAARVSLSNRLEELVNGLRDLRAEYDILKYRVGETGAAYEKALIARIRNIHDSGISEISKKHGKMLESFRELQFSITEKMADICAVLSGAAI